MHVSHACRIVATGRAPEAATGAHAEGLVAEGGLGGEAVGEAAGAEGVWGGEVNGVAVHDADGGLDHGACRHGAALDGGVGVAGAEGQHEGVQPQRLLHTCLQSTARDVSTRPHERGGEVVV